MGSQDGPEVKVEHRMIPCMRKIKKFDMVVTEPDDIKEGQVDLGSRLEPVQIIRFNTHIEMMEAQVRSNAAGDQAISFYIST